jgi:hypothetical protein
MSTVVAGWDILDRMVEAVERVRDRLRRVTTALEQAQVPYAIIGGNAVAAWVASVEPLAVRNTQDVDILLNRDDLPAAIEAVKPHGFIYRHVAQIDMFMDGPGAKAVDSVHIIWAGEKIRPQHSIASPNLGQTVISPEGFRHVTLEDLLTMKLNANRRKDQVHIQDMLGVGLIDASWVAKFPPELGARLQAILDDPEG